MLKIEKEYEELYGEVPKDSLQRIDYLINLVNLKKSKVSVYDMIHQILSIKWKKLSYTIYLLPKATPRPRVGKAGIFYVKGATDNKKLFREFIKDQEDIKLITTPTKFRCKSYFPIPSSMNKLEKICAEMGFIRPTSKPDWDNVAKAYCDMIQGYLLYDDSLVIEGCSEKFYSVKPRIEIELEYMEDYDSNYNKKKILK